MSTQRATNNPALALLNQFKRTIKHPDMYVKYCLNPQKNDELIILISNMMGNHDEYIYKDKDGPLDIKGEKYSYGEYLCRMHLPEGFPISPPKFYFYTPNGLYGVGVKVCVSIGEFHANQFPSGQQITGFCDNLVSGMVGWRELGTGIQIMHTTDAEKRWFAQQSRTYNIKHYSGMRNMVLESYDNYSKLWATPTAIIAEEPILSARERARLRIAARATTNSPTPDAICEDNGANSNAICEDNARDAPIIDAANKQADDSAPDDDIII